MTVTQRPGSATDHPGVLSPVSVELTLRGDVVVDVESRVMDLETVPGTGALSAVMVARPDLDGLPDAGSFPRYGEELLLHWTHTTGRLHRPVVAEAVQRSYGAVWRLTPTGPAVRVQRREYFRVPMALPVELTVPADPEVPDEPDRVVTAWMTDLSEGGLLALVDGDLPPAGNLVQVGLEVDGRRIAPAATVVRHLDFPGGRHGVALRFTDPDRHGDHIRKALFARQRQLSAR